MRHDLVSSRRRARAGAPPLLGSATAGLGRSHGLCLFAMQELQRVRVHETFRLGPFELHGCAAVPSAGRPERCRSSMTPHGHGHGCSPEKCRVFQHSLTLADESERTRTTPTCRRWPSDEPTTSTRGAPRSPPASPAAARVTSAPALHQAYAATPPSNSRAGGRPVQARTMAPLSCRR
jgi:hypothetical protein